MIMIEEWLANKIEDKETGERDNTAVVYSREENVSGVFLHGHHLGNYLHDEGMFKVNRSTLEEHPSATTMSRLRAMGVNVYRKDNVLYLDGKPLMEIVGRYR